MTEKSAKPPAPQTSRPSAAQPPTDQTASAQPPTDQTVSASLPIDDTTSSPLPTGLAGSNDGKSKTIRTGRDAAFISSVPHDSPGAHAQPPEGELPLDPPPPRASVFAAEAGQPVDFRAPPTPEGGQSGRGGGADLPPVIASGIKWRFPPIHPEGRKFLLIAALIAVAALIWAPAWIAWPLVGVTIWVAAFFRDPERAVPQGNALVIAPADGLITQIATVAVPRELGGAAGLGDAPLVRVSIFMSVFDVHINRAPITGVIRAIAYIPGKFLNADLDKASEDNERQHFLIERADGVRIGFTQIAGLVARRIVPLTKVGDAVTAGTRVGLIRFGSRVDVFLPAGTAPRVVLGQKSVAGETVLAVIGDGRPQTGLIQ